nr:uncharacterized protein LOC129432455 [Misgurnus anguillicaudatus]
MGNGQVERFNRTLGNMIRALPPRAKQNWPQMLQTLTFAYNCTAHESTGFAPFYLMYGRIPRLPVDIMFQSVSQDNNITDYDQYVKKMKNDLREAMLLAQANTAASQQRQAAQYNKRIKGRDIEEGDHVLIANKGERGRRKLADKWESTPYVVLSVDTRCHTYRIRNTRTGQEKVVHRNLLLQASFLPIEENDECSEPVFDDAELNFGDCEGSTSDISSIDSEDSDHVDEVNDAALMSTCPLSPSNIEDVEDSNVETGFRQVVAESESNCGTEDIDQTSEPENNDLSAIVSGNNENDPTESERGRKDVDQPTFEITHQVKTRVGRIVKPVNRLIQNMTQNVVLRSPFFSLSRP